ncbi:hypothetical protein DQ04_21991000, partial [Trypanosoma grayi]|uniref:hypothetical protein n=1 Tax=Trypanosoma grayi TaxID=71804 RepID=UPI0004F49F1C
AATGRSLGRDNSNNNNNNNNAKTSSKNNAKSVSAELGTSSRLGGFSGNSPSDRWGTGGGGGGGGGAEAEATDAAPPPWSNDAGFSDRPFQDVARHFKMLEGEFTVIGEHLRQISTHVLQLNDIAERVRNTGSNRGP